MIRLPRMTLSVRVTAPNRCLVAVLGALLLALVPVTVSARKFAGESFSLGVGARALALGRSVIAGPFDGGAGYWNPAGMNYVSQRTLLAMHSETFGSLLNQDFAGIVVPTQKQFGLLTSYGAYIYYLGGDGVKLTQLGPGGRPVVSSNESHGDFAFGFSAAARYGAWNFGATLRPFYRDIGVTSAIGASLDLGLLYQAHRRLRIGLALNDISSGIIRYSDGSTESITPTLRPGFMYERVFRDVTVRLLGSGDLRFEGRKQSAQYWTGDVSLDTHYGLEASYRETVFGRVGADVGDFTVGAGFIAGAFSIDAAVLRTGA
ncbi:MAG: hypothetical protein ACE5GA_06955, partial [Candidatus Zixiibacteriota bacterium]